MALSTAFFGSLTPGTPSAFSAFNLQRTISGAEFYAQGSSLSFEIAAGADLTDGLQVGELAGANPVFLFNGREVGTGRYHPALFQLNNDGTGSIRNSNNMGGVNPGSGEIVDVSEGEEYITLPISRLTPTSSRSQPPSLNHHRFCSSVVSVWQHSLSGAGSMSVRGIMEERELIAVAYPKSSRSG